MYQIIDIDDIYVEAADNYRTQIDQDTVRDLFKSYVAVHKRSGGNRWMLNPIDLIKMDKPIDGKNYRLRIGFRRYFAARYGLEKGSKKHGYMANVPANVLEDSSEEEAGADILMAMVENLQREDVNPVDEAHAIQKALDVTGDTMTQLGKELGRSKGWVSQRLSLLDLHGEIQAALLEEEVTFGHARQLGRIDDKESQQKLLGLVDMNGWDVRELKAHVSSLLNGDPTPQTQFIADGAELEKKPAKKEPNKKDDDKKKPGIRKAPDLTEKVKELSDTVQSTEKLKQAADPASRPTLERESAFYAGAQAGIAWAMGEVEDVNFEEYTGEEDE